MYRTAMVALLVSTSLLAGSAYAQAPATTPAAPDKMQGSGVPAAGGVKFVTDQGVTEFRASKFAGLDIYGPDNEKIGDIVEIMIDGTGQAKSIVIGVGGFLGIGQKNVAVQWSSVTWSNDRPPTRTASTATAPATTGSTAPATTAAPMTAGSPPAMTPTAPARSPAEQAAYNGYPDHGKVQLTKAELQEAPAFRYVSDTNSATSTSATPPATRP